MSFQLSICIPTYNRKRNLSELLDVLAEIRGMADIEVIVSDNASTDGTKEYMEDLVKKEKIQNLRYHRNDENIGPDNNFVMCYKLARGDYVWLLGDDDMIAGDIISIVTKAIEKYSPGVVYIDPTSEKMERSQNSINDRVSVYNDYVDFIFRVNENFFISVFICKKEIIATINFSKYVQCTDYKYKLAILKCVFESSTKVLVAGKNCFKGVLSVNKWDRYAGMREAVLINAIRYEEEKEQYYWFVRKVIYEHNLSTFNAWYILWSRENMPEISLRWKKTIALDMLDKSYPIFKAGYEWLMECQIEEIGISKALEKFQEIKKMSIVDFAKKLSIIYIYGAGYWGTYYKQFLADNGVDINGFIVSDQEVITQGNVHHLSEVLPIDSESGILVAVQYGRKVFDILKSLLESEWKNRMDQIVFIV